MNVIKEADRVKLEKVLPSFQWYVKQYIDHMIEKDSSPTSLVSYLIDYQIFFDWMIAEHLTAAEKIADITLLELEQLKLTDANRFKSFLRDVRKNVGRSRAKKFYALKSLFHYLSQLAEDENFYPLLKRNVMAKIEAGSANVTPDLTLLKPKLLIDNEINEFINFVLSDYKHHIADSKQALYTYELNRERDAAIVGFILGSGLRVSEMVNLDLDDLFMDDLAVAVQRKGISEESEKKGVIFTEGARDLLQGYLEIREDRYKPSKRETAIFLSIPNGKDQGKRYGKRGMQDMVIKYAKAFGKKTTIHKLRQSFATDYNKANGIHKTKEQLGHSKFETTEIYALVSSDEMQQASSKYNEARRSSERSARADAE